MPVTTISYSQWEPNETKPPAREVWSETFVGDIDEMKARAERKASDLDAIHVDAYVHDDELLDDPTLDYYLKLTWDEGSGWDEAYR